ncbi:carboxylating nicotinate-nucleotide diphosphorylase [Fibrobacter sp. UWS1]|uniref:carboxylating nicotinate-nucleotide diphosphorylase n=1 Tax=Fibrobacter sp. UWS1 TaxID=1896220 RepID=UPI000BB0D961|nr:carboxylating nicotinate-nucleotide diphosphorylase [Fibrobacter sp. UWS1]PBC67149.1 nicotinate-nucleotide pyrophosphorylase [carboxylating] [Fibrobacter sp. UWS1]
MYGDNSKPVFPTEDALTMIRLALAEDVHSGDVTSLWTIPAEQKEHARLIAKEDGVIAGLPVIELVFKELKADVQVTFHHQDGDFVQKGDLIAELDGGTRDLLTGERTLLNFIQQLSGVATVAHRFQEVLKVGKTKVLDTRKTIPGFRTMQKYAVRVGGGSNHRMGLFDMVLVKDNHIAACGGVLEALEVVKKNNVQNLMVEMEVENLEDLKKLLHKGVDVIMLDNMSNEMMAAALRIIRESGDKVLVEGSGNMTLERAKEIATLGLDFISVGALTHSVKALDISMRI